MKTPQIIGGNVLELDADLRRRIDDLAKARGIHSCDLVREAIQYFAPPQDRRTNWLDTADSFGLIGCTAGR